jgi:hypothetical protein
LIVFVFCGGALVIPAAVHVPSYRRQNSVARSFYSGFASGLAHLHSSKTIVFVRHAAGDDVNMSLVQNVPDLEAAPVWVVHDRGSEDLELLALAPRRATYLWHEGQVNGRMVWSIDPVTRSYLEQPRHN